VGVTTPGIIIPKWAKDASPRRGRTSPGGIPVGVTTPGVIPVAGMILPVGVMTPGIIPVVVRTPGGILVGVILVGVMPVGVIPVGTVAV